MRTNQSYLFEIDDGEAESWKPGTPIKSEETTKMELAEAWEFLGPCYAAAKYDGFRIQVHRWGQQVRVFSRNLQDWTARYPDLVIAVRTQDNLSQAILDCELIAYDPESGSILPRSAVARSGWAHHRMIVFDLLYLDGHLLINQPLKVRLAEMRKLFEAIRLPVFLPAQDILVTEYAQLEEFYSECIKLGFEGIIMKSPDAIYRPGIRSRFRVKVKATDTIDAVILGYDLQHQPGPVAMARSFLVGVFDPTRKVWLGIARATQGQLTAAEWAELSEKASRLRTAFPMDQVLAREAPEAWIEPRLVVEVDGYGLRPVRKQAETAKPVLVGYELSEARLSSRGLRVDKEPEDATTLEEFLKIRMAPGFTMASDLPESIPLPTQLSLF